VRDDFIGFEVPIAVTMKSTIVWNLTPCSLVEAHQHFGGTWRLLFEIEEYAKEAKSKMQAEGLLAA
jgi:hypothetical protein